MPQGSPISLGRLGADASSVLGIYGGISKGGTVGDTSAGLSAGRLAANSGLLPANYSSPLNGLTSLGGDVLGLYQGIKAGGVTGDLQAGVDAAKIGTLGGQAAGLIGSNTAAAISTSLGAIAAPLALYNFGKTWQSGATGADTLSGLSAGAAVGGAVAGIEAGAAAGSVVPIVGTAIGALIGAAVGAISSAAGGGKPDPETQMAQALDKAGPNSLVGAPPSASFQYLAGIFDAKNNSAGHSDPLEQAFGRMGEGNFTTQMASQINSAIQAGKVPAGATPDQIYQAVVLPWLTAKGINMNAPRTDAHGNSYGTQLVDSIQNLIGAYTTGQLTSATPVGVNGQTITNLPAYAGQSAQAGQLGQLGQTPMVTAPQAAAASVTPIHRGRATAGGALRPSTQTMPVASNPYLSAIGASR